MILWICFDCFAGMFDDKTMPGLTSKFEVTCSECGDETICTLYGDKAL